MTEPGSARRGLDQRWLALPPAVLLEVGIALEPLAWRWLVGGCPRCVAQVRLGLTTVEGRWGWLRAVQHQPGCAVLASRGRVPGSDLN